MYFFLKKPTIYGNQLRNVCVCIRHANAIGQKLRTDKTSFVWGAQNSETNERQTTWLSYRTHECVRRDKWTEHCVTEFYEQPHARGSNPGGGEIFRTCQDRPWAHPLFCTMGTRSFPGVKRPGCGADHPTLLAPRLRMSRAIPLLLL
jgi:hypothetical protein